MIVVIGAAAGLATCKQASRPEAPVTRPGLLLADHGVARLPIVISAQASKVTRDAADELRVYLRRITGAPFEIAVGDGSRGIVLGTRDEFPALNSPDAGRAASENKEAYVIRTEASRLLLLGATDLGAAHATIRLLETVGCRWFFQAPEWEVVPHSDALRVALDEASQPAFIARRISYGFGYFDAGTTRRPEHEHEAWNRHNHMGGSLEPNMGHAWQAIISQNEARFAEHPEYRALVAGERKGTQLCVSNPAVRQLVVDYALAYLRKHPRADLVSLEPSDGGGHCECPACRQLGSISDRVFGLANEVADVVNRELPGKGVGLLAYNDHSEPPGFDLRPNVYVQLCTGFVRGAHSFDELLGLWPRRTHNIGIYDYLSVYMWDFDRLPGGLAANIEHLREKIPSFARLGFNSFHGESGDNWGPNGLGYYLTSKLLWDPNANVDVVLTDFYAKAFGPAAEPMRRYYERFDPGKKPLMSPHLLALGFRDVEEASRLAGDRPEIQTRLDHLKIYLRFVEMRWQLDHEKDPQRAKELTLSILTHVYRTRYTYMNHWEAMLVYWTQRAAKEFNEPTWSYLDPSPKPWQTKPAPTHDEIETDFRDGLAFFRPEAVEERSFSTDLVPLLKRHALAHVGIEAATSNMFQGGGAYALFSRTGEPLLVSITPGLITSYRDRAPARYTLRDSKNVVVAEGRLPLDGATHDLEIKVPTAGQYAFAVDDSAAGWRIAVRAGTSAALTLARGKPLAHLGAMPYTYFYVPKGTKEIQYFWEGPPHRVIAPDDKLVQTVSQNGFVKIPVPAGMDGRAWHFAGLAAKELWFFNIPNYLAASPAALLVPREVAPDE